MAVAHFSRKRLAVEALLSAATIVLLLLLFRMGGLAFLEQRTIDWRFAVRGEIDPHPDVVIIAIDESSFSALNHKWPWPRSWFARIIRKLAADGAACIGIDIIMSEPFPGDADAQVAAAARDAGNVIFAAKFEEMTRRVSFQGQEVELRQEVLKGPVQPIAGGGDAGYLNLPRDSDGFVRRFVPVRPFQGAMAVSFDLKLFLRHAGIGLEALAYEPFRHLTAGSYRIRLDERDSVQINFAGPAGRFPTYSFSQVLAGQLPEGTFRNKVVLIGPAFRDSHDDFATPFATDRLGSHTPLFGVEVHANAIHTLLSRRHLTKPHNWLELAALAVALLLALLCGIRMTPQQGSLAAVALLSGWLGASQLLFNAGTLVAVTPPAVLFTVFFLVLALMRYVREAREKRRIRGIFQKYVSPDVVTQLVQQPGMVSLGGEERELTVLFSDLEGFTAHSEVLSPSEMVVLLSEYFTAMTEEVFRYKGMLKEYVGDELMAIYGAPVPLENHAELACRTALAMQRTRLALRREWKGTGRPGLRARTGINTGPMLVGNMGSEYRFSYGVLGDHVNLASRLEGLNKAYGTRIMIGENTAARVASRFILRELDWVRVKGREEPLSIYELLADTDGAVADDLQRLLDHYRRGLCAYRNREWQKAVAAFEKGLAVDPGDGPSRILLDRCRLYKEAPPEEWDGVFRMLTK
jgi:adenylate cyclase